jgi:hypothetical protein
MGGMVTGHIGDIIGMDGTAIAHSGDIGITALTVIARTGDIITVSNLQACGGGNYGAI